MKKTTVTRPQCKSFVSRRRVETLAVLGSLLLVFGCGGTNQTTSSAVGNGSMSGTAVYGPMNNAVVKAFAISNGAVGAQLGSSTTDGQGGFTISIGSYSGPVMLQMSGGTYSDDATGTSMTMQPSDVMTSAVPSVAAGSTTTGIQVTPLTSMAQARIQNMAGGMTDSNIASANAAMASYFSVGDVLHTPPMNPLTPGSAASASQDAKNYGVTIAAMSEYAATIGMPHSSSVITAMMEDASDGVLNGMMGGTPISMSGMGGMGGGMMGGSAMMQSNAATSGMAAAMTAFIDDIAANKSGVTAADMQLLLAKLSTSNGTLQ